MLVSSQFWALPSNFPPCPCTVSWLGRVAPLAGTTLCRFPNNGTPGHYTASEPTSSLNWGVPSLATPPRRSRGRLVPRAPSLGARAQCTAHAATGAPGPASCGPTRAHYAIPAPTGPLAYRGRLARCPGYPLSDTHLSQPRSQPVNRAPAPLKTGFGPTLAPTTKRLPFCQFG